MYDDRTYKLMVNGGFRLAGKCINRRCDYDYEVARLGGLQHQEQVSPAEPEVKVSAVGVAAANGT